MKKGWFLVGIIFLLVPWLMVGCGVSEEVYNAVVAERDAALAQVTSLQSDLAAAQSQFQTLQSEVEELESAYAEQQSEVEKLEGQLSRAESDYNTVKQKVDKGKPYAEILEKFYFLPPFDMTTEDILRLSSMIDYTGNIELKAKYAAWMDATTQQQYDEAYLEFWFSVWGGLYEALW